jgi:toxin ParE1/3/4
LPKATHSIVWVDLAARDLEAIARFIAREAPMNARRVLGRLRRSAGALTRFPERGRVVPELAAHGIVTYRELVARPYRIIYRVQGRDAIVLAVLDGRRDIEDLLFERLACR